LSNDIKALFKRDRNSVYFLIASALYRDGLAAIFSFGAILAVSVYGMAQSTVLIFGIAANVVAALGALGMGAIEDRIGPKKVIMISLAGLITTSLILLFAHGTTMFWDLRADLDSMGWSCAVQFSGVHGTHRASRPRGRNVRSLRHHRSGRIVLGAGTFRPLLRFVHRPRRYRGHRSRSYWPAH
jgi:MFS-type transporter involved in bile tolerance (Atg22 family)